MEQSCLSCGRDTAPGTRLFISRKRGLDRETGTAGYLCLSCQERSAVMAQDQEIPLSGRYAVIDLPGGIPG